MKFYQSGLPVILLILLGQPAHGEAIDNLPASWQQQLKPVVAVDLSPLKADEQKAITEARARIDALLLSDEPEPGQLASEYGRLGNLYLIHELHTSADACYQNAMRLRPDYFPWAYYSAYRAQKNGDMQAALEGYQKAISLDPDYLPAKYRLAEVFLELNRPDDARTLFGSLMDEPEYGAAANNGLGQVYLMQQDYPRAVEYFKKALELEPGATKIHYPLAMSLRATGRIQEAKEHLQQFGKDELKVKDRLVDALQALRNPASRHFATAMTAVIRKDYATAVKEFRTGLEHESENTAARTSYARVLYLNGNKEEARSQLEKVISIEPDKPLAVFLLAMLEDESGNNEQAAKLYQHVIELDPHHDGANFFLGNHYLQHKEYRKAINHYELATSSNEKNVPALIFMLVAMMGNNSQDQELLAVADKITDRAPNMVSIRRIQILLLALSRNNEVRNVEMATTLAEQMYEKHKFPVNLELLALTKAAGGDYKSAKEQMRQAVAAEKQQKNSRNIMRMSNNLSLLEQGKLPALDWHEEVSHMLPPPTRALATFRDYPDANPI